MPCILKIRVTAGRDLPVMDKASDLTDAYVEVHFGEYDVQRTQIAKKTLNPFWNEDFRLEVSDDSDLQNEPLELRVMDYDPISSNDAIGSVMIDLNPLLTWEAMEEEGIQPERERQLSGWFPIYDSLLGIRGEINVQVRLQFFGDVNPFRDSSAAVLVFGSQSLPQGYKVDEVFGFVEALVNEDDPEYHWSDSFRTPRFSNDTRQRLLYCLSGQLRRILGREVLEMGGNAVVGLKQSFDFETEASVITARATGTCVKLSLLDSDGFEGDESGSLLRRASLSSGEHSPVNPEPIDIPPNKAGKSPQYARNASEDGTAMIALASSSPDAASGTLTMNVGSNFVSSLARKPSTKPLFPSNDPELTTLHSIPPELLSGIGGIVSAKSVKLIQNDEEQVRTSWWEELRAEVKSHAKSLGCNSVMAYTESISLHDELVVLSAIGTAVNVDWVSLTKSRSSDDDIEKSPDASVSPDGIESPHASSFMKKPLRKFKESVSGCHVCHIPYRKHTAPYPMTYSKCLSCKRRYVPEILMTNIELPDNLEVFGEGRLIDAHVCRHKKRKDGESNATIVSESLPFVDFDLHRQLMYKMRVFGFNAIFGLQIQLAIGDSIIIAVASGTGCFLSCLPAPPPLKIARNLDVVDAEDRHFLDIQRRIIERSEHNRKKIDLARAKRFTSESSMYEGEETTSTQPASERATHPAVTRLASGISSAVSDQTRASERKILRPRTHAQRPSVVSGMTGNSAVESRDEYSGDSSDDDDAKEVRSALQSSVEPTTSIVVQVDDDADEDLLAVLLDPVYPDEFQLCNIEMLPWEESEQEKSPVSPSSAMSEARNSLQAIHRILRQGGNIDPELQPAMFNSHMIFLVKVAPLNVMSHHPNRHLATVFRDLYEDLRNGLYHFEACLVLSVRYSMELQKDQQLQVSLIATVVGQFAKDHEDIRKYFQYATTNAMVEVEESISRRLHLESNDSFNYALPKAVLETQSERHPSLDSSEQARRTTSPDLSTRPVSIPVSRPSAGRRGTVSEDVRLDNTPPSLSALELQVQQGIQSPNFYGPGVFSAAFSRRYCERAIDITPASRVAGSNIVEYLGRLNLHFVKEDLNLHHLHGNHETLPDPKSEDDLGRFENALLVTVLAGVRAHVRAMGGHAIVGLRLENSILKETVKNQAYGIVSVSGDVVTLENTDKIECTLMSDDNMVEYLWNKQMQNPINLTQPLSGIVGLASPWKTR